MDPIAYASYAAFGFDADHHHGIFPKKELYKGPDRDEAIACARQHAGAFDRVTVEAMGEYEDGFDSREPVLSIRRATSPA